MKWKMMLIFILSFGLFFSSVQATSLSDIEIFDVQKQKVVRTVANRENIQEEMQKCLKGIQGVTKRLSPIPNEGQIIKIPIQPSVMVNNQWMNSLVDEVKIILPKSEKPLLMLFDDENQPHFFEFEYDLRYLLTQIEKKG